MSTSKVKNTYLREIHWILEGLAFIGAIVACANILISSIAVYIAPLVVAPENTMLFASVVEICSGVLFLIVAASSKIRSLAIECAVAAWIFYGMALFKYGYVLAYIISSGSIGAAPFVLLVTLSVFASLIVVLSIALRKNEYQIIHTYRYKLYRILRGLAFILVTFNIIVMVNDATIFPAFITIPKNVSMIPDPNVEWLKNEMYEIVVHIKEYIHDFKYVVHRIALIGGIEGVLLIMLGFLSSLFSLGIELIVLGWSLIGVFAVFSLVFLYAIPYFIKYEIITAAGINSGLWFMFIAFIIACIMILFLYFMIKIYIKRYNARESVNI